MSRVVYILIAGLLLAIPSSGQTGRGLTSEFAGTPSGSCSPMMRAINTTTGDEYNCSSGAWHKINNGGGAVSSVFGRTGAVAAASNDYSYSQLSGIPSTFTPSAHSHVIGDTTGLQTALDGKQPTGSYALTTTPSTSGTAPNWVTGVLNIPDAGTSGVTAGTVSKTKYDAWDAKLGAAVTTLNTLTGATQTFATPGTTGTAPSWSSTGTAHTLNIPMASAASVTAGLLSKTDYDTFNGKQAALGFTPENSANKNAASGYAGLSAGSKITSSQMSAVLASSDLTNDSALEKTANKNAASGYAGLDGSSKLTGAQQVYGTAANTAAQGNDSRITGAEQTANKNAASGYAGLTSGTKLTASEGQEVWALADLSDFTAKSGAGTTGIGTTLSSLATSDILKWSGTDWVNATAAPKATALAATPALCSSGQAPTGVLASGDATGCTTITGGGSSIARLTGDTAGSATNTLVTTGMTFSIAASTVYTLSCDILYTVSTTSGVGLTLGVNGPGTPTQVTLMRVMNTTATAFRVDSSASAAWAAKIGTTATTVTALSSAKLSGTIENGTTPGTLDIQYANIGTTGTTIVKRGSFCRLQ